MGEKRRVISVGLTARLWYLAKPRSVMRASFPHAPAGGGEAYAMLSDVGNVSTIQRDGDPPTVETAGATRDESGVAVVQQRF
jgi:hypothetical protein